VSTKSRILIFSSAHLCRNPRVLKEATTLGKAGYDVTVASLSIRPEFEEQDQKLMQGLPFRRVTVDHTGSSGASRRSSWFQRAATKFARQLSSSGTGESGQALGPANALYGLAKRTPADLIIAHTEIPLWAASRLMEQGQRVAVDFEDWYSEDLLPEDREGRPLEMLREAEEFALRNAVYTSAPSEAMAEALARNYGGRKPIVIRNSLPLQPSFRSSRNRYDPVRMVGCSPTIGPGRGLEPFLEIWAKIPSNSEVHLIGDPRPDFREQLVPSLHPSCHKRLHWHAPVPPRDLPGRLAEFDVGLALELDDPLSRNLTITNKLLQYLNAGLAVMATDTTGQWEVWRDAPDIGLLLNLRQAGRTASEIESLLRDPDRLQDMQRAARRAAQDIFCWEKEASKLLDAVRTALA